MPGFFDIITSFVLPVSLICRIWTGYHLIGEKKKGHSPGRFPENNTLDWSLVFYYSCLCGENLLYDVFPFAVSREGRSPGGLKFGFVSNEEFFVIMWDLEYDHQSQYFLSYLFLKACQNGNCNKHYSQSQPYAKNCNPHLLDGRNLLCFSTKFSGR